MTNATTQTLLTRILTNRINAEATEKTLVNDTDIETILDEFVSANKITLDQYNTLTALISSTTNVDNSTSSNSTTESTSSTTSNS
jgi:hypothetical protein